jgi:hypothetical protein
MTTLAAAKDIHRQTGAPFAACMRWAAQCRVDADDVERVKRSTFFSARKEELRGARFRRKLAACAPTIEGSRGREGRRGMGVEYCPKREAEAY